MKTSLLITVIILLLGTTGAVRAAEAEKPRPADAVQETSDPELEKKIRTLINMLGDADWNKREAATTELQFIGKPAIPYLIDAKNSSHDPEVRSRAEAILNVLMPPSQPPAPQPSPLAPFGQVIRLGQGGVGMIQIGGVGQGQQRSVSTKTFIVDGNQYTVTRTTENQVSRIKVEVIEQKDGKAVKRTVEADNERALARKDPELFKILKQNEDRAGVQGMMSVQVQTNFVGGGLAPLQPGANPADGQTLDLLDSVGVKLVLSDDGPRVSDVKANSLADRNGLKIGDVLVKVNGQMVVDITDARKVFGEIPTDKISELEIQRDGRTVEIKVAGPAAKP